MSTSSTDPTGSEVRFVADPNSGETMVWLLNFNKILTKGMNGTLAERHDLSGIKAILDIACGPGGWALEVAREHPDIEVTGIDISPPMIRFAAAQATARGHSNAYFNVMDAKQRLDFPDDSFDLVNERTLFGVMAPREWPSLLAECSRILRPGGIIRLTEPEVPETSSSAFNAMWSLSARAFFVTGRSFSSDGQTIGITPMLEPLLQQAGYQNVQSERHNIDISAGTEDAEGYRRNAMYALQLTKPFLLGTKLISEAEYDELYQRMIAEMLANDFRGTWLYLTAWGTKP